MTNPADAALYGLHDGLVALAWLAGAALPLAGAALVLAAAVVVARGVRHRATSARLHRAARRSGRTTDRRRAQWLDNASTTDVAHALQDPAQLGRILDGSEPILPPRS